MRAPGSLARWLGRGLGAALALLALGCAVNYEPATATELQEKTESFLDAKVASRFPLVRVIEGPYVDIDPIETSATQQRFLERRVSIFSSDLSFGEILDYLLGPEEVTYIVADDLKAMTSTSIPRFNFEGDLNAAISQLVSLVGGGYEVRNGVARLFLNATRDFPLAVPGGQIQWNMSSGGGELGSVSGGQGGGSASTVSDTGTINASASLSLWQDIENSLQQFLEGRGTFQVSEAAGVVTVTASVKVLDEVEAYIESINHQLGRRIEVELTLMQVSLSDTTKVGINWQIAARKADAIVDNLTTPGTDISRGTSAIVGPAVGTTPTANGSVVLQYANQGTGGRINYGSALIQALREQGHVVVTHSPKAVTLNNQPAILSDILSESYLASTQPGVTTGSGNAAVGLEPGSVSTGTQFMVIPKIVGPDIVVYIQAITAENLGFQTFTSGSGAGAQTIQIPRVTSQGFSMRFKVRNGASVVIGGLTSDSADIDEDAPYFIDFLGSSTTESSRKETVMIVTARAVEG